MHRSDSFDKTLYFPSHRSMRTHPTAAGIKCTSSEEFKNESTVDYILDRLGPEERVYLASFVPDVLPAGHRHNPIVIEEDQVCTCGGRNGVHPFGFFTSVDLEGRLRGFVTYPCPNDPNRQAQDQELLEFVEISELREYADGDYDVLVTWSDGTQTWEPYLNIAYRNRDILNAFLENGYWTNLE